ncbi:hypothetical protein Y013_25355 (plasmid) [Rhodococcus pyridinivorans SB3094]|uniref:Uncharacterized protein n=1 Tax=Rhodococcus pyridinivorans SB3094 TaxID=1435356 RepID=V9XQG4_9NOCA|nr:hypothetical protein [Rhodococcus pyridinivorans]AHD24274.1 hypothetical protein Y013_25355 [Rhodococcus pyridinivorans SB3094]
MARLPAGLATVNTSNPARNTRLRAEYVSQMTAHQQLRRRPLVAREKISYSAEVEKGDSQ